MGRLEFIPRTISRACVQAVPVQLRRSLLRESEATTVEMTIVMDPATVRR